MEIYNLQYITMDTKEFYTIAEISDLIDKYNSFKERKKLIGADEDYFATLAMKKIDKRINALKEELLFIDNFLEDETYARILDYKESKDEDAGNFRIYIR